MEVLGAQIRESQKKLLFFVATKTTQPKQPQKKFRTRGIGDTVMKAISWVLNVILGLFLLFLGYLYVSETNKYSEVLKEFSKIDDAYKKVLLNPRELVKYEPCYNKMDNNHGDVLWRTDTCLKIVWKEYQNLKKQKSPDCTKDDQLLITCQNNLKVANNRAQSLENDLKVERQNVTAKEEEIKASKEESSTTVAKKDSNNGKKKVKKGSSKSGKDGVASSDCLQTCNEMVAAAVDPLEKTIAGLKTELTTAQELNKNYKQVIQTLEDDVQNKAQKIQELEEKNDRLIREIGDDGFSEGDASIRGVPSHTNNVGCALSWSTAQPNAPPGV